MANIEQFLAPSSNGSPGGIDIASDPLMYQLRSSIQGRMEQSVVLDDAGNRRIEAVWQDPDWREVRGICEEGLERSRHLELCVAYAAALLQTEGLPGAADALELVSGLVCQSWEHVYPQLDPDDDYDPGQRLGILENLSQPPPVTPSDDPVRFIDRLRKAPLCQSRVMGTVTLADFRDGRCPDPSSAEAASIHGAIVAMRDTGSGEALEKNIAAVDRAIEALNSMESYLSALPNGRLPGFELLHETLKKQKRFFDTYGRQAQAPAGSDTGTTTAQEDAAAFKGIFSPNTTAVAMPAAPGQITGSADVVQLLDRICDYYEKSEPSSPVPLLLKRAKRLVGKNFMEVMNDLAADSVSQLRIITGQDEYSS